MNKVNGFFGVNRKMDVFPSNYHNYELNSYSLKALSFFNLFATDMTDVEYRFGATN